MCKITNFLVIIHVSEDIVNDFLFPLFEPSYGTAPHFFRILITTVRHIQSFQESVPFLLIPVFYGFSETQEAVCGAFEKSTDPLTFST